MPEKWDDAREKRLLLEVITISNPTIDRSAWAGVAAAMGGGFSAEACRQKFQGIKRTLKSAPSSTPTPTPTKPTKRKHATPPSDDDEPAAKKTKKDPAKKIKTKTEDATAMVEVFKKESCDGEEGVDLENDALYADAV